MGLDQLRKSIELKERFKTTPVESYSRNSGSTLKPAKKPLMERYRRQKINNYLEELKYLVLSALNKEVSLYNKMEKADILDMAVKYIKAVRPTTPDASPTECQQRHEQCTTTATGYQVERTSPLGVQSSNINYNKLHQSSQVVFKKEMKENCATSSDRSTTSVNTHASRTFNIMQHPEQQVHNQSQQNRFNQSFTIQTDNCNRTAAISTAIWRPW